MWYERQEPSVRFMPRNLREYAVAIPPFTKYRRSTNFRILTIHNLKPYAFNHRENSTGTKGRRPVYCCRIWGLSTDEGLGGGGIEPQSINEGTLLMYGVIRAAAFGGEAPGGQRETGL